MTNANNSKTSITYEEVTAVVFHPSTKLEIKKLTIDQISDDLVYSKLSSTIARKIVSLWKNLNNCDPNLLSDNHDGNRYANEIANYAHLQDYMTQKLLDPATKVIRYFLSSSTDNQEKIDRLEVVDDISTEELQALLPYVEKKVKFLFWNKDDLRPGTYAWSRNAQDITEYQRIEALIKIKLGIADTVDATDTALIEA